MALSKAQDLCSLMDKFRKPHFLTSAVLRITTSFKSYDVCFVWQCTTLIPVLTGLPLSPEFKASPINMVNSRLARATE